MDIRKVAINRRLFIHSTNTHAKYHKPAISVTLLVPYPRRRAKCAILLLPFSAAVFAYPLHARPNKKRAKKAMVVRLLASSYSGIAVAANHDPSA